MSNKRTLSDENIIFGSSKKRKIDLLEELKSKLQTSDDPYKVEPTLFALIMEIRSSYSSYFDRIPQDILTKIIALVEPDQPLNLVSKRWREASLKAAEGDFRIGLQHLPGQIDLASLFFKKAAKRGLIRASYYQARCLYALGYRIAAHQLVQSLAKKNVIEARFTLGCFEYHGVFAKRNVSEAQNIWSEILKLDLTALNGSKLDPYVYDSNPTLWTSSPQAYCDSLFQLGFSHYYEENRNIPKAIEFWKLAAERGHADAQTYLGLCYNREQVDNSRNMEKAIELWTKAAEQNHPDAQFYLGHLYYRGIFVTKDFEKAITYLQRATKQNQTDALWTLGKFYSEGVVFKKNPEKAFQLWCIAAERDHVKSQVRVGLCYQNGEGVEEDTAEALNIWLKAAENESLDALYYLGITYQEGKGVKKDLSQAIKFWSEAASKGHADSSLLLGVAYYDGGEGVEKDYSKAKYHWEQAAVKKPEIASDLLQLLSENIAYNDVVNADTLTGQVTIPISQTSGFNNLSTTNFDGDVSINTDINKHHNTAIGNSVDNVTISGNITISGIENITGITTINTTGLFPVDIGSGSNNITVKGNQILIDGLQNDINTLFGDANIGNINGDVNLHGKNNSITSDLSSVTNENTILGTTLINNVANFPTVIGNSSSITSIIGPTNINTGTTDATNIGSSSGSVSLFGAIGLIGPTNINTSGSSTSTQIGESSGSLSLVGNISLTGPTSISGTTNINIPPSSASTQIGNSNADVDINGEVVRLTGVTTINTSPSTSSTHIGSSGAVNINGSDVNINKTNTLNTTVGNGLGSLKLYGNQLYLNDDNGNNTIIGNTGAVIMNGNAGVNINSTTTGTTNIGNSSGDVNLIGATANINVTNTGNTNVGNDTGNINLIAATADIASSGNASNINIGSNSSTSTIRGTVSSISNLTHTGILTFNSSGSSLMTFGNVLNAPRCPGGIRMRTDIYPSVAPTFFDYYGILTITIADWIKADTISSAVTSNIIITVIGRMVYASFASTFITFPAAGNGTNAIYPRNLSLPNNGVLGISIAELAPSSTTLIGRPRIAINGTANAGLLFITSAGNFQLVRDETFSNYPLSASTAQITNLCLCAWTRT